MLELTLYGILCGRISYRSIQNVGWTADTLSEPKHPSAHLIQQSIANFKKVEGLDLGAVAPGTCFARSRKRAEVCY